MDLQNQTSDQLLTFYADLQKGLANYYREMALVAAELTKRGVAVPETNISKS